MSEQWRLPALLVVAAAVMLPASLSKSPWSTPVRAADCTFVLGFATLRSMIPDIVGDCLVDEHHNPENGDGLQETTGVAGRGGLMVWRKADNWTAYTDGYRTWINGPLGLQSRLNTERFSWESAAEEPAPSAGAATPEATAPAVAGQPTAPAPANAPRPAPPTPSGGPRGTLPLPPQR